MTLLTPSQLTKLKNHQYSANNGSFLDPYLQPWWNKVVSFFPMWMAPNLITILGLIVNIITSLIYVCHAPHAKEEVSWWVPFSCGLGLFIYQTLDAIDGKQARRTGSSNALGELFDHGCDSLSTVVVSLAGCCMLGLGELPYLMLYQTFAGSFLFYLAHWQTYVTGTMRFGKFDVTEAQFSMIALMLTTAVLGSSIWSYEIFGFLTLRWLPVVFATVAALSGIPSTVEKILFEGAGKNGSTVAGTSVLGPIFPLLLVAGPGYYAATNSDLYLNYPVLFNFIFGLIGTKITNKLIVAQMTRSEMTHFDMSMFVPWTLCVIVYFNVTLIQQHILLIISLVFVLIDLLWYCRTVCLEICAGCGWNLFTISPQSSNGSGSSVSAASGPAMGTRARRR